jgi:DeoR family glycerol-3-phosphate regulon repressor
VLLAGGEVRADDSAAFGPSTLAFLEQFQADTAIISAAAINAETGVMDNHLCEAEVCQALIRRAHRVILAADHTKFAAQGLVVACKFEDIDLLVTDAAPPAELAKRLEAADVEVQIAG